MIFTTVTNPLNIIYITNNNKQHIYKLYILIIRVIIEISSVGMPSPSFVWEIVFIIFLIIHYV